jgi:hypothetical protein
MRGNQTLTGESAFCSQPWTGEEAFFTVPLTGDLLFHQLALIRQYRMLAYSRPCAPLPQAV